MRAEKVPPTCYVIVLVKSGAFTRADPAERGYRCDGTYHRT